MKLSRLSGRKNNDMLLRKGNVWKGKTMRIRWMPGAPRHPLIDPSEHAVYAGTAASAKLNSSAVKRNRMRRRCREALRIELKNHPDIATVRLLLCPGHASLDAPFTEIQTDIRRFLSILPPWQK